MSTASLRKLILYAAAGIIAMTLAACSSVPAETPRFAVAPDQLGRELSLAQRLEFSVFGTKHVLDAWLEADAQSVRLAALVGGQTALSLDWNGKKLSVRRSDWVPESMDAAQILSDLQFVFWPPDALRAQLPAGWQVEQQENVRTLRKDAYIALRAEFSTALPDGLPGHVRLQNNNLHYTLDIDSSEQ